MRDTCHTDLIFLKINNLCTDLILDTYTTDPDNPHTYTPGYPLIDTQYLQHIESLFQSEVTAIEEI